MTSEFVFAFFVQEATEHRAVNVDRFKIKMAEVNGKRKIVACMARKNL